MADESTPFAVLVDAILEADGWGVAPFEYPIAARQAIADRLMALRVAWFGPSINDPHTRVYYCLHRPDGHLLGRVWSPYSGSLFYWSFSGTTSDAMPWAAACRALMSAARADGWVVGVYPEFDADGRSWGSSEEAETETLLGTSGHIAGMTIAWRSRASAVINEIRPASGVAGATAWDSGRLRGPEPEDE